MGKPKTKKPQRKSKRKVKQHQHQHTPVVNKEMEQTNIPFEFESLPNEVIEHILSKLPLEAKKSARLVSSRWYQMMKRNVEFKMPLNRDTLLQLRYQDYEIKELEVVLNRVDIPAAFRFTPAMKRTFLTSKTLSFMADDYVYVDLNRKQARNNSFDGEGVMNLIRACKNIHTFKFNFEFLNTYNMISPLRLNNIRLDYLQTMQLKLAYGGHPDVSYRLLELITPQLRNLDVERFLSGEGSKVDRKVYLALQSFIGQNKGNLKTLKLINFLTNFTLPSCSNTVFPEEMLNDLDQLQLDSLEIQHKNSRFLRGDLDVEDWDAADRIMNQQCLKSLKLDMISDDIFQRSYTLLTNCRNTLIKLELNVEGAGVQFDLTYLLQLRCLTNLTFTADDIVLVENLLPPTIKYLVWNAPLPVEGYSINQRTWLPHLLKFALSPPDSLLLPVNIKTFCHVFFGISSFNDNLGFRTKLEQIIVRRLPLVLGRKNSVDIAVARRRLPREIFNITYDTENIYIEIQKGLEVEL